MLVVVVLVVVAVVVWRTHARRSAEWRHGGDGLKVSASIRVAEPATLAALLASEGVPTAGVPGVRAYVVRVCWHAREAGSGSYQFILLDNRVSPPRPIEGLAAWREDRSGFGPNWAGAYNALPAHYAWLAGTAPTLTDQGWIDTATTFGYRAMRQGSGTMTFTPRASELAAPRPEHDLLLAVVRVDAAGTVRWAKQVRLRAARAATP